MRSVNIREARQKLSDLVDVAEHGESVLITRHGKEVARLEAARPSQAGPLPDLDDFRESIRVKGKPLSRQIEASRRQER